jgi:hypothetical protein
MEHKNAILNYRWAISDKVYLRGKFAVIFSKKTFKALGKPQ